MYMYPPYIYINLKFPKCNKFVFCQGSDSESENDEDDEDDDDTQEDDLVPNEENLESLNANYKV